MSFESNLLKHEAVIKKSINYLISSQEDNGSWIDWKLPVGYSDAWITSYVGYNLSLLPTNLKNNAVRESLKIASLWCKNNMYEDGGWGFNKYTGSDADTTAFTLLFLFNEKETITDSSKRRLKAFQNEDGGFGTYNMADPNHSWGRSHPDVTPVVLKTLLEIEGFMSEAIKSGIEFCLSQQTKHGLWNSFWWKTPLYATFVNIDFLSSINSMQMNNTCLCSLFDICARNPFEISLLLNCLLILEDNETSVIKLVEKLQKKQKKDMFWKSSPTLRVTNIESTKPWIDKNPGTYYKEENNLFTTVTAVSSLVKFQNYLKREV